MNVDERSSTPMTEQVVAMRAEAPAQRQRNRPWGLRAGEPDGRTLLPTPPDVDPADINQITGHQAWLKYALPGRLHLAGAGARAGLHVFSRWSMWDLSAEGHTIIVTPDAIHEAPHVAGASLTNYWLP